MSGTLLIDSIVRQTTVLIASLATAAGNRSSLAHVANQVLADLVFELKAQGIGNKVIADMFGMALRTYHDRVARLSESRSEAGRSLWDAVLSYIQQGGTLTRGEILRRFNRDGEAMVAGVLRDLVGSGLVFRSGQGDHAAYRAATAEEQDLNVGTTAETAANMVLVAVHRHEPCTRVDGRFSTVISPRWVVWSPQGGYLMAVVLRAAGLATEFRKPLSLACHFLSVPKVGPAEIQVTSLRKTRIAESLRLSFMQDGRLFLESMLWAGDTVPGLDHAATDMPDVPGYEGLAPVPVPAAAPPIGFHTLWRNLEIRPCGPQSRERTAPAEPRQRDWIRFRNFAPTDDAFVDAGRYALCLDTFTWPAATHAHVGNAARFIAPTLSFSIDFHGRTDSEWLLSDAHAPYGGDGRLALHQRVWSPDGALIASGSGTMICRPRPSGV
jgi:acyl-CoA thioesterase